MVKARFVRGFCDFWCFGVVFLWSGCDPSCGKDGFWMHGFRTSKIMQFFGIYFSTGSGAFEDYGVEAVAGVDAGEGSP